MFRTTVAALTALLVVGQFGTNRGFGAVLTPLEDSTLVVYRRLPNHPLELEQGDVILGYDGVLWKDLYPRLIKAELPLFVNPVNGSTDEANQHYLLEAAGLNWHLFDTLDVVKASNGDTLHFDTNLLANENRTIWGSEHIDIPGVEWPNRSFGDRVGSGVIDGTDIGYVYVTSWSFDAQFDIRNKFRLAVIDLWFTQRVNAIVFDERADPVDHLAMRPDPVRRETNLVIRPDPQTFWDRPIAVLIGPGAISAGELEARRASFHPRTRIFGLPAGGGNTGSIFPTFPRQGWFGSLGTSSQYLVAGHQYIPRTALQPDERVWHTQEAVANGRDAVVDAAVAWINSEIVTDIEDDGPSALSSTGISVYPNPTQSDAIIGFTLERSVNISVKVYDVLGREVADLARGQRPAGSQFVIWNMRTHAGQIAPNGTYFIRFDTDGLTSTKSLIVSR